MFNHISSLTPQIYFGKYIDSEVLDLLIKIDIDLIVNLCHESDNCIPYDWKPIPECISFPIVDCDISEDHEVIKLVNMLCSQYLSKNKKIYIHCIGGHGRSATIAGILLGISENIPGPLVLSKVYSAHQERLIMKDKWRNLGAPQTNSQKQQILRLCPPEKNNKPAILN